MMNLRSLLTKTRPVLGITSRNVKTAPARLTENDVEEIIIPVPWGHIAGKWWGDRKAEPILGIHGWQDNANSFDRLIPLLNTSSFLAIDAPGHGHSSHLPPGRVYNFLEYIFVIRRVINHLHLKKFSIFGHSFGGVMGYVYSSLYPDEVTSLMSFECARSLVMMYTLDIASNMSSGIDKILKIEKQLATQQPPSYKLPDLVKMYSEGSVGSITPESALILLKRGAAPVDASYVPREPEKTVNTDLIDFVNMEKQQVDGKAAEEAIAKTIANAIKNKERLKSFELKDSDDKLYIFTRDPRIKVNVFGMFNEEHLNECARNIKCPVLSMRAKDGFLHGTSKATYESTMDILEKNCRYFEHHEVKGSHHGHINNPEHVAPIVNNFLENINCGKWWGPQDRRPLLCLHGWQDNAGTFDKLIPLLPSNHSYLAIDFPGHGSSSHIQKGLFYLGHESFSCIRRIQKYYNWHHVSLLSHSLGSIYSFLFSCIYPEDVDFYIGIDAVKPSSIDVASKHKAAALQIEKQLQYDSLSPETTPAYTEKELIERWVQGARCSITEDSCRILMKRGTVRTSDDLYKLVRDPRVKGNQIFGNTHSDILKLAENINCKVLIVKAIDSCYFEKEEKFYDVLNIMRVKAKYMEYHKLPGTHHLHLNTPEVIAPVITNFLEKVCK